MKKVKKAIKTTLIVSLILLALLICFFSTYYIFLYNSLSLNTDLLSSGTQVVSVFNQSNEEILPYCASHVNYSQLKPYTIHAFTSIEDKKFYSHHGINYKRIGKAIINNLKAKDFVEGASTISQQLIKNTHLNQEKTIKRKLHELILTKKLEKKYSKDEIMENYLNAIYFGNNSYGLEQASFNYFNKSASNLSISESATLAGIIKSPKNYSPLMNIEKCKARRNLVLKEMFKDKKITQEEYFIALNQEIVLSTKNDAKEQKHYFNGVILEASKILNLSEKDLMQGGYMIFTYQEKDAQSALLKAIKNESYYHKNSYGNTADSGAIIIDNKSGGIIAFGGKSDYDLVNMKRSPGSAIKPILVFAPAIDNGTINTLTPILDEKTDFNGYSPQNVGGYYGYVSPQKAIEKSLNVPAVKILKTNGIKNSINFAKKAGIEFNENDNNLSIALGCLNKGTSIINLAGSYTAFANNGAFITPRFIRKICNHKGEVIYKSPDAKEQIMSEATSYLMTQMLISGVKQGTSKILNDLPYEVAGKTGTCGIKNTNLNTDAWSVAYTTKNTALTWLGNSTGKSEYNLEGSNNGGTYATRLLKEMFEGLYQNAVPCKFAQPQDVVYEDIDLTSLKNKHIVEKASCFTPQKDKIKAPFNIKYVPHIESKNYSKINSLILVVSLQEKTPKLVFDTSKLYAYEIYRTEEDKTSLLTTINNTSGKFEYIDKTAKGNNFYSYFVIATPTKNQEEKNIQEKDDKKSDILSSLANLSRTNIFKTKEKKENDVVKSNIVKIFVKN